jgi:hypothetical protein
VCERELDALGEQFGFTLRRPVTVVVLAHAGVVRQIMGRGGSGFAVAGSNAIIISADYRHLPELIRHELAHLFSARWSSSANGPSHKSEGLAVWCQKAESGVPIDVAVLPHLRHRGLRLPALLTESYFRDEARLHACYLLAGSFTGFLIRRYGRDAYRRFYREATRPHFHCAFQRHFGMTLKDAERHWRKELTVLRRRARTTSFEKCQSMTAVMPIRTAIRTGL